MAYQYNAYDPPPIQNQIDPSLMGNQKPQFDNWRTKLLAGAQGLWNNPDLAMALLANSGYSPQKRSFGEILGTSLMQAQGMKQQREDDAFKREYMKAQMEQMQNGRARSVYGAVSPDKFTPESLAKFEQTGKYSDLVQAPVQRENIDTAQIRNDRYRKELKTDEERRIFDDIMRNNYGVSEIGGVQSVVRRGPQPTVTPLGTLENEAVAASRLAEAKGAGGAIGEAAGGQAAKNPAKASLDYVVSQFEPMINETMSGGLFGAKGAMGTVLDKADKERFNNLREQLSTELRTVFRIPGEGTLSDQEQKQYGLQLPSTEYEAKTNAKILRDVQERVRLRLETSVGSAPAAQPTTPQRVISWDELK